MQEYVAGFMFDRSMKHVALVRKNRPAWQKGKLNAIGGKIEPGEEPLAAMVREFQEETGVLHELWEPTVILEKAGVFRVHFYRTFSKKVQDVETKEDEVIGIYPVRNLNQGPGLMTISNLAWLVPLHLDLELKTPVLMAECV